MLVTKTSLSLHDMIYRISSELHVDYLELVSYIPDAGYGMPPRVRLTMSKHEFKRRSLSSIRKQICGDREYVIGVSSSVRAGGEAFHLPQIDFSCDVDSSNEERIYDALNEMNMRSGYLLESGNSYHFHGMDLMPHEFWTRFMDRLENYATDERPLVDETWLDESAIDRGFSILRLSANVSKRVTPKVIAKVDDEQIPLFNMK